MLVCLMPSPPPPYECCHAFRRPKEQSSLSTHHNLHSLCEELTYCLRPFVETAARADAQVPIMTDDVGGGRGFTL